MEVARKVNDQVRLNELLSLVVETLESCVIDQDEDGELIIYTGIYEDDRGYLSEVAR